MCFDLATRCDDEGTSANSAILKLFDKKTWKVRKISRHLLRCICQRRIKTILKPVSIYQRTFFCLKLVSSSCFHRFLPLELAD
jgi:hypothetical protein